MSDLEATGSRGQAAAQITAVASGKLRAFSGQGLVFSQAGGLADAFAEVFARIAASTAQPIQSQEAVAEAESIQIDTEDQASASHENTSQQSESADATPVKRAEAEQLITEVDPQVAVAVDANGVDQTGLDQETVTFAVDQEDQLDVESIDIAAVEVNQSNDRAEQIEAPEVIVQQVGSDDTEHHRRERREESTVAPVENTESGRQRPNRTTDEESVSKNGEEPAENDESALELTDQSDRESPSRRLRGRHGRHRESIDDNPRPVTQASQGRAQQAIAAAAPSGETAAGPTGQTTDAPAKSVVKNAESTIVNVQSVAAKAQQSGTTNAGHSGTRGSTQAVEATTATRPAPGAKPDSSGSQSDAAETVARIKLIQRVSKAFQHLGPEGGVVRLRLAPAEMGSVRVEMRINQRTVQARVVAETEAASKALREHLPDLRARLESFGMQVEKIEIETETSDRHQGSPFDAETQQQQQGQHRNDHRSRRSTSLATEPVSPQVSHSTPTYQVEVVSGGVDIRL